jgi:hypothetical protein
MQGCVDQKVGFGGALAGYHSKRVSDQHYSLKRQCCNFATCMVCRIGGDEAGSENGGYTALHAGGKTLLN